MHGSDGLQYGLPDTTRSERAAFLERTYFHLLGAVLGCVALVAVLTGIPVCRNALMGLLVGNGRIGMIVLLLGCMGAQWYAHHVAHHAVSRGKQYFALGVAVVAEALLLSPLLILAERLFPGLAIKALVITAAIFGLLTAIVHLTRWNFKWLGPALWIAGIATMGVLIVGIFVPMNLGIWFIVAMLVLSVGYILYDTSNVLHEYPSHMDIAGALELFTSVTMLFWYVLRLLMSLSSLGED
jgi:hypothetical protein